jgi:hypothetical protein
MTAGVEAYGGLGSSQRFGFADTAHYVAPAWAWQIGDRVALRLSSGFGLTHASEPVLLRMSISYEFSGVWHEVSHLLRGKR